MLLTLAGDAVRNAWTLCGAGGVLPLAQGAVCGPLCALVGLRVRSVSGSRGRWSAQVRAHGQNRDRTWAHGRPQCQYHWGVHCRLHTLSVLCSCAVVALLPALYACRQIAREVVKWCCGGLPPPGKGPSPAVWGEGLYRTSLGAGCELVFAESVLVARQDDPARGSPPRPVNPSPVS